MIGQLFAQTTTRTFFEWGRIQSSADWLLPLAVLALVGTYVVFMYRRDSVELRRGVGQLLVGLRLLAFVGLLLIFLKPQWRTERLVTHNSRVLLLDDTSLSMGLVDRDPTSSVAPPSRGQQVIDALSGGDLLARLRKTHDVALYRFDDDLEAVATLDRLPRGEDAEQAADRTAGTSPTIDWPAALAPRGTETRLGQAIREAILDQRSAPVAGVVAITDGRQNVGIEPSAAIQAARDLGVPIFAIGMGSDRQAADARIADLIAPARAFPDDAYKVTAYVQAVGLAGETATVELVSRSGSSADGNTGTVDFTQSQEVLLPGDGEPLPVEFTVTATETGHRTLAARLSPPVADQNPADDSQEVDIEIVESKLTVLLFAGGPSKEYQFLRNQLKRDKGVLVDVLLQTSQSGSSQDAREILADFPSTRPKLFAYDCIVALDPNWEALDANQLDLLEEWVADQAGGLIVAAGTIHTSRWTQSDAVELATIRDLYPVEFPARFMGDDDDTSATEPRPLSLTREGLDAPFLRLDDSGPASEAAWAAFPGVYSTYRARGPKRAATVYAAHTDAAGLDGGPVFAAGQFFGSGRVFYLGSAELWRLRELEDAHFERVYTQLIRHVSQGRVLRGSTRGVLLVERDRYSLGDTIALRAQLNDAQLKPLAVPAVDLEVAAPDGSVQTVSLAADPAKVGLYQGQLAARSEGTYRLEIRFEGTADEPLSRRVQVRVPDRERENPQRNDELLNELAGQTDGVYYVGFDEALGGVKPRYHPDAGPLDRELKDQTRTTYSSGSPVPLWDNWWTLGGIVGLLSVEWLIRRLAKLA